MLVVAALLASLRPGAAHALEFWVDGASGSDARSLIQAQSAATPWKTIGHALATVTAGHTIRVRPGVYPEPLESQSAGVSLVADGAPGSVVVMVATGVTALLVRHPDFLVSGVSFQGGLRGVRSIGAARLVVRDAVVAGHSGDAVVLDTSPGARLERVSTTGGKNGIRVTASPGLGIVDLDVSGHSGDGVAIATSGGTTADGIALAGGARGFVLSGSDASVVHDLLVDRGTAVLGVDVAIDTSAGVQFEKLESRGGAAAFFADRCPDLGLRDFSAKAPADAAIDLSASPRATLERVVVAGGVTAVSLAEGAGSTVRDATVSEISGVGFSIGTSPNSTIERATLSGGTTAFAVTASDGLAIRNATVSGISQVGFSIGTSPNSTIERATVDAGTTAFAVTASDGLAIRDATVSGISGVGFSIGASPNSTIERASLFGGTTAFAVTASDALAIRVATVSGISQVGFSIGTSPNSTVERATLSGGTTAFAVTASDALAIRDATVSGHSGVGLSLVGSAGASIGNASFTGGRDGLVASACGGLSATGLHVSGHSGVGVSLQSSPESVFDTLTLSGGARGFEALESDALVVRSAMISGPPAESFVLEASSGVQVDGLSVSGGTDAIVADRCASLQMRAVTASGHAAAGVLVSSSPAANLDGVTLSGGTRGVRFSAGDSPVLRHATITAVNGSAVSIADATGPLVEDVRIDGCVEGLEIERGPAAIVRRLDVSGALGTAATLLSAAGARVEDSNFDGGVYGLRVEGADGVVVEGCRSDSASVDAFAVIGSARPTISNSIALSPAGHGILVDRSPGAYVRNNLVVGARDWGIDLSNVATQGGIAPVSIGNVVAFNTVANSGGGSAGGLRMRNATGEVRDNIFAGNTPIGLRLDTAGVLVHHDLVFGSGTPVSPENYAIGGGVVWSDPRFVAGDPTHPFALAQVAAGQAADSPAVDAGSAGTISRDIGGATRTDGVADTGVADMGFHADAPAPGGPPEPVKPTTLWVNCATGNDTRGRNQAVSSLAPLSTIQRALSIAIEGDRIVVQDGTCPERATIDVPGLSLEAENVGGVVIEAPADQAAIRVRASRVAVSGFVLRSAKEGVVVAAKDTSTRLMLVRLRNLRVEAPEGGTLATNGIRLVAVDRSRVESCEVHGAGQQGIVARTSGRLWIRNNLVTGSGEWGIHVDNGDGAPPIEGGNVVLFNTVDGNGGNGPGTGGIRLQKATGEIGWNIVSSNFGAGLKADTAPTWIHHVNFFGNAASIVSEPQAPPTVWSLVPGDPLFVDRENGDFALRQVEAGQAADSPAVDAAGVKTGRARIKGSTRSDGVNDDGIADLGFHATRKKLGTKPVLDVPPEDGGRVLHVDGAMGDDGRTAIVAIDPQTPWKTIARAFQANGARTRDTVVVAAGTYDGGLATVAPGVTLRASGAVTILAPSDGSGISVGHADTVVEGFRFEGGRRGVTASGAPGLVLRSCTIVGTKKDAVVLDASDGALVDHLEVHGGNALLRVSNSAGLVVRDLSGEGHEDEGIVLSGSANGLLERLEVAGGRTVVDATGSTALVIRDLSATAIRGDGLILVSTAHARLERVTLASRDAGLRATDSPGLVVSHLAVSGQEDEGVVLADGGGSVLEDVEVTGGTRGFAVANAADTRLERVTVTGARGGVVVDGSSRFVLRDATIGAILGNGVTVRTSPEAVLDRLHLQVRDDALAISDSAGISVNDLDANGHTGVGVTVTGSADASLAHLAMGGGRSLLAAALSPRLALRDSGATGLTGEALVLLGSEGSALEQVEIAGGTNALRAEMSPGLMITGFSARGHSGIGIALSAGAATEVETATLEGGSDGVVAEGCPDLVLRELDVRGASGSGVDLKASAQVVIEEVSIDGGIRGLRIADGAGLRLSDASVVGASGDGISLGASSGAVLERVTVEGGSAGVVAEGCPDLVLRELDVRDAIGSGVDLKASAQVVIEGVSIDGGIRGLRIADGAGLRLSDASVVGASDDGISLGASSGAVLERVTVEGGNDGIVAEGCPDLVLRDIDVSSHDGNGAGLGACPRAIVERIRTAGGSHGLRGEGVAGIALRDGDFSDSDSDAILLVDAAGALVDGNRVDGAGAGGIVIDGAYGAYVHNNRIGSIGDWGISIGNPTSPSPARLDGNVVAFNTVWQAGLASSSAGGVRFENASGEIRDNVVVAAAGSVVKTDLAPSVVHHNVLFGGARSFDSKSGQEPVRRANRVADPLFVAPAGFDFALRQTAAGQGADSPARDAGSGPVSTADIAGTTRSDAVPDAGLADAGWHALAPAASMPAPAIAFTSGPGLGNVLFVDPAAGDDSRDYDTAQEIVTPWRSVARAMQLARPGDVVALGAGVYAGSIEIPDDAITLRGTGPRGGSVVQPADGEPGIVVEGKADVQIEDLAIEGGSYGVLATAADGLRLRRVAAVVPAFVGIDVRDTADVFVDGCIVTGAGSHGIALRRSTGYVHNDLVYANGEWGISIDNSGASEPLSGIAVAFNTVHGNGSGIRMLNAGGEVRDNLITEQVDLGVYLAGLNLLVHHNDFSANARDRDQDSAFADTIRVWASIDGNPRYLKPAGADGVLGLEGWRDDDFRLRQRPGETPASPMVDAGSGAVEGLDIGGSTRSDGVADSGTADLGFHYAAPPAVAAPTFASHPTNVVYTYYVSATTGADGRSTVSARHRETPWATIGRALQAVAPGDTIVVLAGRYAETVQVSVRDVSVVSEVERGAMIAPVAGNGVSVEASGVLVRGFVVEDAPNNGISILDGSDRVEIRDCVVARSRANGLLAKSVSGLLVEGLVSVSSTYSGIVLRNTTDTTVRDLLAYENGEWGLNLNSVVAGVVSAGHLVERSTLAFNKLGDLRLARATGTIRDNLLSNTAGVGLRVDTAGVRLLHNGFFADAQEMDPETYILSQCAGCAFNVVLDPSYVKPAGNDGIRGGLGWADDDFRLSQTAAGQAVQSQAVDAGSLNVDEIGPVGSTAIDGSPDGGVLDLGVHR